MFLLFSFSVNSQITVFNKTYDTDTTIEGNNGIIPISGGYITIDGIIFNKNGKKSIWQNLVGTTVSTIT